MRPVAALFIDPRGPYASMSGVDAWDASRDARLYAGPHPVVAHPPCASWSSLRHMRRPDDGRVDADVACGPRAVELVRYFGGVLEQPAGSKLWDACDLPAPGNLDAIGAFSVVVDQCAWGHVARKRTWLYLVGVPVGLVERTMRPLGEGTPTHWCSGGRKRSKGSGGLVPPGIKVCSAQQRRRTPVAFAEWLVSLARAVTPRTQGEVA